MKFVIMTFHGGSAETPRNNTTTTDGSGWIIRQGVALSKLILSTIMPFYSMGDGTDSTMN